VPYGGFDFELLLATSLFRSVILYYHNITPAKEYFPSDIPRAVLSILGRVQMLVSNKNMLVITCSDYNVEELRRYGYNNVINLPNFIDVKSDRYVEKEIQILFVGRIAPNKGCLELIKLIKRVRIATNQDIQLKIVGRFCASDKYKNQILNECKNQSFIHIERNELDNAGLQKEYRKSILYVSCATHEGFGLPVMESIQNGTAALYTPCGGTESVLAGIGCYEYTDLCKQIITLLDSPNRLDELLSAQQAAVAIIMHIRKNVINTLPDICKSYRNAISYNNHRCI
jgi:glycosyltransferase involved in cell wall biosynthesis